MTSAQNNKDGLINDYSFCKQDKKILDPNENSKIGSTHQDSLSSHETRELENVKTNREVSVRRMRANYSVHMAAKKLSVRKFQPLLHHKNAKEKLTRNKDSIENVKSMRSLHAYHRSEVIHPDVITGKYTQSFLQNKTLKTEGFRVKTPKSSKKKSAQKSNLKA
mmetsp:Transcript_23574/g.27057  ORF Transcript_23574/g.27057 Transcript_23574/m.27057 type:complete len:164 (+) Transcript_23574:587-1078(+)